MTSVLLAQADAALEPTTGVTAMPQRADFVSTYTAFREVGEDQAGKLYDLLAAEPEFAGAIAEWVEHIREVHSGCRS